MIKKKDDKKCIYCEKLNDNSKHKEKIIAKNSAATVFLENSNLDYGDLIIIPNKHIYSLTVCPDYYLMGMFSVLKYIESLLTKNKVKYNLIFIEEGFIANQKISHFSIKIIILNKKNNIKNSDLFYKINKNNYINNDLVEITEIVKKAKE